MMQPFRDLIKPKTRFYWDAVLETLFQKSKDQIVRAVEDGLKSFEPDRITCLQTDFCREGIGYLLLQKHCPCTTTSSPTCCETGWKLIFAGSRFTNPSEHDYSPTEGEALAVSWGLAHSKIFTLGCPKLIVSSDHKPLLGLLNDRDLSSIESIRLRTLKENTFPWQFTIHYNPGKWHRGPDAVSRNPTLPPIKETMAEVFSIICCNDNKDLIGHDSQTPTIAEEELIYRILTIAHLEDLSRSTITYQQMKSAASQDTKYMSLIETIRKGFPKTRQLLESDLREFWEVRDRLSSCDGIVYMDMRIVMPSKLRKLALENLHTAHLGISSMKARANQTVYWPGLSSAIKNTRLNCGTCNGIAPSQSVEPLVITKFPEWPFQKVAADYFFIDLHSYLVYADRFSGWISAYHFKPGQSTHKNLISTMRALFMDYGIPEELSTDGGPQFIADGFEQFLKKWGVSHRTSSADYPKSNGRAEIAVKSAKRIIIGNSNKDGSIDNDTVAQAIMQFRNTPLQDVNLSPAQILYHRQLREPIPAHRSNYKLHHDWLEAAQNREIAYNQKNNVIAQEHNRHSSLLPPLPVDTLVLIQGKDKRWKQQGLILESKDNRQYLIRLLGSGRTTKRNRRFIKQCYKIQPNVPAGPYSTASESNTISSPQSSPSGELETSIPRSNPEFTAFQQDQPSQPVETPTDPVIVPTPQEQGQTPETRFIKRMPRALRNLQTFNKPGLKE